MPLGLAGQATCNLASKDKGTISRIPLTSVSLFEQGLVQVLQAAVTGLEPKHPLCTCTRDRARRRRSYSRWHFFTTNPAGAAIVNAIGPLRQFVRGDSSAPRRFLVIAPGTGDHHSGTVQVQTN